jgi:short subunit dehydrogenase-like uncharacterized protein
MSGRIVLYGATGYMGGRTARALIAGGARPILAGRDPERLDALAEQLSIDGAKPQTAVADTAQLRSLIEAGDVLVSTAGPFMKIGRPAVAAAADAGAIYLDSSGEPPFIRAVFEEFGPQAERNDATLLTAFGYDYVPGNLAGALALQAGGPTTSRLQIGYFVHGNLRGATSAGTRASVAGVLLEDGYAFRGHHIVSERTAAHVATFDLEGTAKQALSIGSSEHFALPRLNQAALAPLTEVGVYLGWFGRATRLVHYASGLAAPMRRYALVGRTLDKLAHRIQRSRGQPGTGPSIRSDVVAVASDASGRELATIHLSGADPYSFTASILAWAANRAATAGIRSTGAIGPVEAFGAGELEAACADSGFRRANH